MMMMMMMMMLIQCLLKKSPSNFLYSNYQDYFDEVSFPPLPPLTGISFFQERSRIFSAHLEICWLNLLSCQTTQYLSKLLLTTLILFAQGDWLIPEASWYSVISLGLLRSGFLTICANVVSLLSEDVLANCVRNQIRNRAVAQMVVSTSYTICATARFHS